MSTVYISEPPTNGKVVISTTCGDIDIELWSRECPLACRNFISHCLNGYYDKNIFHRVIKDFMIQTGDPTGTGTGGQSIWGKPFKDECHQRIKFNHRGLVAMANSQKAHSNESQWFVTLKAAEWLDKKHTIFGKVTGNTIFNVLRIGEVEVEEDRPLDDVSILSCEVLNNPFPDIVVNGDTAKQESSIIGKKEKKSVKKDNKLLSFGDDNDSDDEDNDAKEMMKRLAQKKRAKQEKHKQEEEARFAKEAEKRRESEAIEIVRAEEVAAAKAARESESMTKKETSTSSLAISSSNISDATKPSSFSSSAKEVSKPVTSGKKEVVQNRSFVEEMRAEYAKSKGKEKDNSKKSQKKRQNDTLAKLSAFTSKMKKQKTAAKKQGLPEAPETENYHGQVMEDKDDGEVDINSWHVGKLVFRRHIDDNYRNVNDVDNYVTINGDGASKDKESKERKK